MADKNNSPHGLELPKKQRGLFKKKRGGVVLSKDEVIEIKKGRKKLRKDLKRLGEKDRKEFEVTASALGLYFDKTKTRALLWWFFATRGGWILLGSALALLLALYGISIVTEMKGHFTISMADDMFREGFSISEDRAFTNPTGKLFATPAVDVPCISIVDIPEDIHDKDGQYFGDFFAYSFYLRNEGDNIADYNWELRLVAESKSVSTATWIMIFEDSEMSFYAKADENGNPTSLPAKDIDSFGYTEAPFYDFVRNKEGQFEVIKEIASLKYWRLNPIPFASDDLIASRVRLGIAPGEVHKYTVVVWLEGDDIDCKDDLIGGHVGLEMNFSMLD